MKYVSDKAKADPNSLIDVPKGGSFDDMLAAEGDKEIGDRFNKIIAKLAEADGLQKAITMRRAARPHRTASLWQARVTTSRSPSTRCSRESAWRLNIRSPRPGASVPPRRGSSPCGASPGPSCAAASRKR